MLDPAFVEIYETNTNLVNFKYRASERYEVSFVDERTSAEMQFYIYVPLPAPCFRLCTLA